MKDIAGPLQDKLYSLLNGNISATVYRDSLPAHIITDAYVLLTTVTSNDRSTFSSANTSTVFQFNIYTRDTLTSAGSLVNIIAGQIYDIIYPAPNSVIDLSPDFQNVTLELASDNKISAGMDSTYIWLNRFISFRANILHN